MKHGGIGGEQVFPTYMARSKNSMTPPMRKKPPTRVHVVSRHPAHAPKLRNSRVPTARAEDNPNLYRQTIVSFRSLYRFVHGNQAQIGITAVRAPRRQHRGHEGWTRKWTTYFGYQTATWTYWRRVFENEGIGTIERPAAPWVSGLRVIKSSSSWRLIRFNVSRFRSRSRLHVVAGARRELAHRLFVPGAYLWCLRAALRIRCAVLCCAVLCFAGAAPVATGGARY